MRHLLIIFSLLLLSSPVIGQETGVLYQYETSSGIQWKTFGDGKVQPKYKVEIKNGIMDGLGVLTYPYSEKSVVGEWANGKEWNTKHTKKDGTLIGKWVNGEWKISLGVLYPRFRNGKTEWFGGTRKKSDFLKYVGEIENGLPNGQGTITTNDGYRYNGNWKDGKQHGQGTFTSLGGRVYIGDYIDDKRHGLGIETFPDGTKYVGEWKNGFIWNGKMEDKDGKILGNFVNGVYN